MYKVLFQLLLLWGPYSWDKMAKGEGGVVDENVDLYTHCSIRLYEVVFN
jgi:hypothetical protein